MGEEGVSFYCCRRKNHKPQESVMSGSRRSEVWGVPGSSARPLPRPESRRQGPAGLLSAGPFAESTSEGIPALAEPRSSSSWDGRPWCLPGCQLGLLFLRLPRSLSLSPLSPASSACPVLRPRTPPADAERSSVPRGSCVQTGPTWVIQDDLCILRFVTFMASTKPLSYIT